MEVEGAAGFGEGVTADGAAHQADRAGAGGVVGGDIECPAVDSDSPGYVAECGSIAQRQGAGAYRGATGKSIGPRQSPRAGARFSQSSSAGNDGADLVTRIGAAAIQGQQVAVVVDASKRGIEIQGAGGITGETCRGTQCEPEICPGERLRAGRIAHDAGAADGQHLCVISFLSGISGERPIRGAGSEQQPPDGNVFVHYWVSGAGGAIGIGSKLTDFTRIRITAIP